MPPVEYAYSFVPSSPDVEDALRDRVGSEITWVLKHRDTEWRGPALLLSFAPAWGPGDEAELVFDVPDLVQEEAQEVALLLELPTVIGRARSEAAAMWKVDFFALPTDRLHELDHREEPVLLLEVPTSEGSVLHVAPRSTA